METLYVIAAILGLTLISFAMGRQRAVARSEGQPRALHSLPNYHGHFVALWCAVPALILLVIWVPLEPMLAMSAALDYFQAHIADPAHMESVRQSKLALLLSLEPNATTIDLSALRADQYNLLQTEIRNMAAGTASTGHAAFMQEVADYYQGYRDTSFLLMVAACVAVAGAGAGVAWRWIAPEMRARNRVEQAVTAFMILCSTVAILTTLGIVLSLLFEAIRFFAQIPLTEFLFGLHWSPQTAIRADQVGSTGSFGAVPLFAGTLLISFIAMCVAVPIGLLSAIYMAEYAHSKVRAVVKPLLEILAGIPTVVYGFFAALTVAPFFRDVGESIGLDVSSESALAAGMVMGIMIIPFVSSLSDDVITAVPQSMREGSYGLGATKSETVRRVILPAALPGIVGGILLAVSRAIGETMIVVMAAGLGSNLTANPLEAVTTVTVQIVTLLVGDQEFDSPKTLAAFALGLVLFIMTLCLNIIALHVVRKYREQYD
ncbi:phosphate ABC transporter permease subunit PstC [Roseospira marina]|uniref:Phosphate transport system permease protein n=1 Tax=Roseospira marina TaxID=140057 RepID=A0A5M6IEY0_9PROT|nr:phosphate ABC transporter permease subunit PstC [Roseospira marina]KAA5606497.1 phosphate ABC transporter permease subunit PstC [Roseospira marina]MBB4314081.1 phosphate transport system permease protein [Roseospira marina]MBB5087242.1 phosphate transport system permease protein [Roseospira marina]